MSSVSVTIRMDEDLKRQAEQLFDDMGMNMTTAITIFTKTAVRERRIPFEIKLSPNADTMAAMDDARNRRNLAGPFHDTASLMEALNSDDA